MGLGQEDVLNIAPAVEAEASRCCDLDARDREEDQRLTRKVEEKHWVEGECRKSHDRDCSRSCDRDDELS